MRRRMVCLALVAGMALLSSGCSLFRRKPKALPPAPPPAAVSVPQPELSAPPPPLPEPPAQAPPAGLPPGPPAPIATPAPKSAPPLKTRRRAPRAPKPVPAETTPSPAAPVPPPPPAPRLGEVLSAERRSEMNAQLDASVAAARRILGALSGRSLTPAQSQTAARARAFLDQALGLRAADLGTAVELSRRALLLAQDLADAPR
ncbi:MAG: hypothetical protein HY822_03655 [Acidobacteria bacterium]|nr:hypothetical protein [Acidobacteriota bacterium]